MRDAAPPSDQVWNFNEDGGDTCEDPRFSLGIETYPGRVLGATHEHDVIQLLPRLKDEWSAITAHYARIGLPHTHHVAWDDSHELAHHYPEHTLSTFFFGEQAHAVRPNERWYHIVHAMNSKNECMRVCNMLGIPTPHTQCFTRKPAGAITVLPRFPLFIKADVSVSGRGVVRCATMQALEHVLSRISPDVPFQLQEEVRDVTAFLNVQYRIEDEVLRRSLTTVQILEGNAHKGNLYPSTCPSPWIYTDPLAEYMQARGMEDVFAFDLAVDVRGAFFVLECNPRYNGSTYPSAVAKKLRIPSWRAQNFETRFRSLGDIRLGSRIYDPETKRGVVFVNWGAVQQGVVGMLLAGTKEEQAGLATALHDILM